MTIEDIFNKQYEQRCLQLAQVITRCARLEIALAFYADPKTYEICLMDEKPATLGTIWSNPAHQDCGKKALEALKE